MSDKKEFHYFTLPEYEEEEQYLREMANKGYLLENVSAVGIYQFKKSEPIDMVYRIDFNPQKKENRDSYLQMYKDYGWDYLLDVNEFSYFCKPYDGAEDDIFSDNESRVAMIKRIVFRKMLPILALFILIFVPQYIRVTELGCYTDPLSIFLYILCTVCLIIYVSLMARCYKGFKRLKEKYDIN